MVKIGETQRYMCGEVGYPYNDYSQNGNDYNYPNPARSLEEELGEQWDTIRAGIKGPQYNPDKGIILANRPRTRDQNCWSGWL